MSTLPGPSSRHSFAESELLYEKLAPLSARLGLPTAAIRGIATKAAEILQKDGAITNTPAHPSSAKMVISHSGKRPHLVLKGKAKDYHMMMIVHNINQQNCALVLLQLHIIIKS